MPTISVIVPVYNTEKQLERCLESILQQTFSDFEVIVLNDGSPDRSEEVILRYAQQDKRIRYYRHANRGLGPTRNRGVDLAEGEYLAFVDSDDYILPTMLADLYAAAQEHEADVACGQTYLMETKQKGAPPLRNPFPAAVVAVAPDTMVTFLFDYYFSRIYSHSVWDKLYRTDLIKRHHILFGDNKQIFAEDNFFQIQVLSHVGKVAFVAKPVYYYVQHPTSITNTPKKDIFSRQLRFMRHFIAKYQNQKTAWFMDAHAIVCFDSLKMQVLNHIAHEADKEVVFQDVKEDLALLLEDAYYPAFHRNMLVEKAYRYDPNRMRSLHMRMVSWLLDQGKLSLAAALLCLPYWVRGG